MNIVELHTSEPAPTKARARNFVIQIRRYIRILVEVNDFDRHALKTEEGYAKKLEAIGSRFDAERIKRLSAAMEARRDNMQKRRELMRKFGELLIYAAREIDALLTLSERCDLLNINIADRAKLQEEDGIVSLVHIHKLEDSATYRGQDWKDGPLNAAMTEVYIDFLCNTPEGRAVGDTLFQPGGMFEFLPRYKHAKDGAMVRQPPPLRLA